MDVERIQEYIDMWEAGSLTDNALHALIYIECTNNPAKNTDSQPSKDGQTIKSLFDTLTQEQKELVYYLLGSIIESINDFDEAFEDKRSIKSLFDTLTEEQKELVYYLIGRAITDTNNSEDSFEKIKPDIAKIHQDSDFSAAIEQCPYRTLIQRLETAKITNQDGTSHRTLIQKLEAIKGD